MTEYQPGRMYSGIVNGERRLLMRRDPDLYDDYVWDSGDNAWGDSRVTDVRGPLVVLDMHDFTASTVRDLTGPLRDAGWNGIADQIEAQTTPPLNVHSVAYLGKGTRA